MYESFFKLRVSPFQLIPDSRFFYDSDTHRHALIKLRQSRQNKSAMTVVHGDPGTGKTELLTKFVNEFDSQSTVIANIPLSSLRANNILDYIASAFGVINMGFVGDALWSKDALIGKIQQQISMQSAEGKNFVIFIDNAESLSKNCYKKISQLCSVESNGVSLVQCYLFGETSVVHQLHLDQKISGKGISKINLQVLGELDTHRYIEHRLIESGWQGDPEISTGALSLVYQISEGIPWHINLLCHRVFLQCYLENLHVIDERLVKMFSGNNQYIEHEVAGSDVTAISNVVTLSSINQSSANQSSKSSGRSVKGISLSSDVKPENRDTNSSQQRSVDSISYFFDKPEIRDTLNDDVIMSFEDVQHAFDESFDAGEELGSFASSVDGCKTDELFFPEVNEPVEPSPGQGLQGVNSLEDTIVNVSRDEDRLTAHILQRIFPKTVAMMEDYSKTSFSKTYPVLEVPMNQIDSVRENKEPMEDLTESHENCQVWVDPKSPFQIATRASIITSLVITLVMWVISDTRTVDTQSQQSLLINDSQYNSVTPSPFQNPNDLVRSLTKP